MTTPCVLLACQCGSVEGQLTLDDTTRFHLVCYCCDCQAYAQQLQQADTLLDEHGGTELVQTYPANMQITQGHQHIACMKLSEKGIYRWYTRCCHTPIGNTVRSAKLPFVGIPVAFMRFESASQKKQLLGPIAFKVFAKYGQGQMPEEAYAKVPFVFLRQTVGFLLNGFWFNKQRPSPFFRDGSPVSTPQVGKTL